MVSDYALDLIIETLIRTTDPYQRSVVVHNLVQEIQAIVSWLGADESGSGSEVVSVNQVLAAACEHQRRMEHERTAARE